MCQQEQREPTRVASVSRPMSTSSCSFSSSGPILKPRPHDILSGKDKLCVAHEGSKRFRAVVETYRHRYSESRTKYQKMMITKEIYESLNSESCRFLKYNSDTKSWEELSPMAARDKVGHALRFANRKNKRQPVSRKTESKADKPKSAPRSVIQLVDQPVQSSEEKHRHKHTVTPIEYEDSYMQMDASNLWGIPEVPSQDSMDDSQDDGIWPTSLLQERSKPGPMGPMPPLPRIDHIKGGLPGRTFSKQEFDGYDYGYSTSPTQWTTHDILSKHHRATVSEVWSSEPAPTTAAAHHECRSQHYHSLHDHHGEQPPPQDAMMACLMQEFSEDWDPNLDISPAMFA